jgi:hypothetical protein
MLARSQWKGRIRIHIEAQRRIRIHIEVKRGIRIRIKVMRIRNPDVASIYSIVQMVYFMCEDVEPEVCVNELCCVLLFFYIVGTG